MLEAASVFLIFMLVVFIPLMFLIAIWYVGVFALFCMYRHNGGKYRFSKFVETRGLYFFD